MVTSLLVRVDNENNAEEWWGAVQALLADANFIGTELHAYLHALQRDGECEVMPDAIEAFDRLVTSLPGWEDDDAPEYAPYPLVFTPQ